MFCNFQNKDSTARLLDIESVLGWKFAGKITKKFELNYKELKSFDYGLWITKDTEI